MPETRTHPASLNEPVRTPAVCLRDVTFSYNGRPALLNVNLDIPAGKFSCIIGPNGGGKSTMLKLVLGLLHPDQGDVRVLGATPAHARARLGYTPQHAQYDPLFPVSVTDVVLMGMAERHWGGRYSRAEKAAAAQALEEMRVAELGCRPFADLSGGQRQRVLIARALVSQPEMLLLDEPTASVDPAAAKRLIQTLETVAERRTVLMVSHDPSFIFGQVSSVVCVNQRAHIHPTSELTTERLRELYGADVRLVRHDMSAEETSHKHA